MDLQELLGRLDPAQRLAATSPQKKIKVNAGAGTGKTTTLTARIAFILDQGWAVPSEVMAITFANKAAREIRERVVKVIGAQGRGIRIGTFHSQAARILRRYAAYARFQNSNFIIVDDEESKVLIDEAVTAAKVFEEFEPPPRTPGMTDEQHKNAVKEAKKAHDSAMNAFIKDVGTRIMRWKEAGLTVEMVQSPERPRRSKMDEECAKVFMIYQDALERRNACDFADLISKLVGIFENHPSIGEEISRSIKYLLVDEYQDCNVMQHKLVGYLCHYHGNRLRVGDFDQSIFSFRGSCPEFMQQDEPGELVVNLEINRRCTDEILAAANMLVDLNPRPDQKVLKSGRSGQKVSVNAYGNEFQEAHAVAAQIKRLHQEKNTPWNQIALLYRTNDSRLLHPMEQALLKYNIPYSMVSGISMLKREEIKDFISYLRLAVDPYNDLAFRRVANRPIRGLGPAAVDFIYNIHINRQVAFHEACILAAGSAGGKSLNANAKEKVGQLGSLLSLLADEFQANSPLDTLFDIVLKDTGYLEWLSATKEDAWKRIKNIEAVMSMAGEYEDLADFLQQLSLQSDDGEREDAVVIMTMHAAKGLEFDYVITPAFEEGVIPHHRALEVIVGDHNDPWIGPPSGGLEEERRLGHVAWTRAKHGLFVSFAAKRGQERSPSHFIRDAELPMPKPSQTRQGGGQSAATRQYWAKKKAAQKRWS
jgi:DNA helicase-2/ATP-dependent DNA helicase PcrA